MSAQGELAGLIQIVRETPGLGSLQAAYFLRDHGPAIAELIEAAKAREPEFDSDDEINAALRKLTQEA